MPEENQIAGTVSAASTAAGSLSIGQRDYYSTHLIFAAHLSAFEASRREGELAHGEPRFDPRHRAAVITALIAAAGFLEAAINEVLQDAADDHITPKIANVTAETRSLWSEYWMGLDNGRRGEVLEKYQAALKLAGYERLPKGEEPYQSARLLLRTRNMLLHFKPETRRSDQEPAELVNGLRGKVKRNPQVAGDAPPTSLEGLLSADCARWAVRSAKAFAASFADHTATELNYQVVLPRFLAEEPDLPEL